MFDQSNATHDPSSAAKTRSVNASARSAVPTIAYAVFAALVLGAIAHFSATRMILDGAHLDMWQHIAAVRALISDLANPANPFVASDEGSRHFHPLWIALAAIAQATGSGPWEVMFYVPYISMFVLALAVFTFCNAFFRTPWAPIWLLAIMLFGWGAQIGHTGFHNAHTLSYSAPYPATFLVSFGLILSALTIWTLEGRKLAWAIVPLVALMFTTHQLGAGIAFIAVGCLVLFTPNAPFRNRAYVSLAVMAGLAVTMFWPYHNPIEIMLRPGNSTWVQESRFYDLHHLAVTLFPAAFGIWGLKYPRARPFAIAALIYFALFLLGLFDVKIAIRFLMPAILMLHIGLVAVVLRYLTDPETRQKRKIRICIAGPVYLTALFLATLPPVVNEFLDQSLKMPIYESALRLTAEIDDAQPVAAYELAAWPIAATGQRVSSVPWPEPGIHDLAERQVDTKMLFENRLHRDALVAAADALGVRSLFVIEDQLPMWAIEEIMTRGARVEVDGSLIRIDLFPDGP